MSEKQLTVAELMARAAAEGRDGAPRRRRRRSLEDGGVSVAELTGSLPKVEATPEQPRHTSQPIDAPQPEPKAEPKADQEPQPEPKSQPQPAQAQAKPEPVSPEQPKPAAQQPENKPAGPTISVIGANDPIKLTTDQFPAQAAATPQVKEEPKPQPVAAPKPAVPTAPTVTRERPEEQTMKMPAVQAAPVAEPKLQPKPQPKLVDEDRAEDTGVIPAVVDKPAEVAPIEDESEDAGRVSIVSVLLMVIAGVALGAAIFLGFRELWANVNSILVGALAGVMTLGLVGVVHALRTERDGMSMTLAAITGVALTFGPLLIAGL